MRDLLIREGRAYKRDDSKLDPKYADVICKRYQELTGKPAVLAAAGALYADLVRPAEANASEVNDE